MENIGLDLHQRESRLCLRTEEGEVIERRIRTTPERLTAVLGPRAPARILILAHLVLTHRYPEALAGAPTLAKPHSRHPSMKANRDRRDGLSIS